ncbi:hypothetical protein B0T13DRAFT_515629 [Neurospora crassa]|nr:hypothetical protein B0T13DRAFT_515629 [Neurospora crassa]
MAAIAAITYSDTPPPVIPTITQRVSVTTQIVAITKGTNSGTKDDCSTRTVCLNYVDSCGQTAYDGSVPDCKPVAYVFGSRSSSEAYYYHTLLDARGGKTVEAVEATV